MIALDTSALMAIVLDESEASACTTALGADPDLVISAGTIAEALVVAGRKNVGPEMAELIAVLSATVVPVTAAEARRIGAAYAAWGKGVHPARLNFGDCFAYVVAKAYDCPLLYVGGDFSQTDLTAALPAQ